MIVFFALLGISCKRKIPEAHTSLEVVRVRYGMLAPSDDSDRANLFPSAWFRSDGTYSVHGFVFDQQHFCLCQYASRCCRCDFGRVSPSKRLHVENVADLRSSGMHIIAATFLLPVGVTIYTFVGGIKATYVHLAAPGLSKILRFCSFLTDYFHTAIILIIACYFSVKAFANDQVGSVGNLFELLQAAAQRHPVSGNQDGTYLTMTSKGVRRTNPRETARLLTSLGNPLWYPPHLLQLRPGHCK